MSLDRSEVNDYMRLNLTVLGAHARFALDRHGLWPAEEYQITALAEHYAQQKKYVFDDPAMTKSLIGLSIKEANQHLDRLGIEAKR